MVLFTTPSILVALILVSGLHIASSFTPGIVSKILNYVNIALHLASLVLLMWQKCEVDETLLFYIISIFVYTVIAFVRYEIGARRAKREEAEV